MNTLVTGAAGYIGSHAAKALATAGHKVLAIDTLELGHAEAIEAVRAAATQHDQPPDAVAFEQCSTLDHQRLAQLIQHHSIETVMHFAAFASVPESVAHPLRYDHNNTAGTIALLLACDTARSQANNNDLARRFVFSSTCATYGEVTEEQTPITEDTPQTPTHAYGRSKLAAEHAIADYARAQTDAGKPFKAAALRYFNVAGADPEGFLGEDHTPETHLIPLCINAALGRRDRLKVFGTDYDTPDGTAIRDYIHVTDLTDAHIKVAHAMDHNTPNNTTLGHWSVYNLGSGTGHSVREVLDATERVLGKPVPTEDAPRRPGDPPRLFADPAKFRHHFNQPAAKRTLDEQVAHAAAWFETHPNGYKRD